MNGKAIDAQPIRPYNPPMTRALFTVSKKSPRFALKQDGARP